MTQLFAVVLNLSGDGVRLNRLNAFPIGKDVTYTVRQFREKHRLGYAELSRKLAEMGRDIPPLGLRRIESGERRVDVDDLVALALTLEVSPLVLLLSRETSSLVEARSAWGAEEIWAWATGSRGLAGSTG